MARIMRVLPNINLDGISRQCCFAILPSLLFVFAADSFGGEGKRYPIIPTAILRITLDAEKERTYSDILTDASGVPMYRITVEPDYAVGGKLVNWSLGLYRIRGRVIEKANLLEPHGWHGLQANNFNVFDVRGRLDRGYGPVRVFRLRRFSLVAVVEDFKVSPAGDAFQRLILKVRFEPRDRHG